MGVRHMCRSQRAWIWRWLTTACPSCVSLCFGCVLLLLASSVRNTGPVMTYTRNTGRVVASTRNTEHLTANTRNTGRVVAYTRNTAHLTANTRNTGRVVAYTRNTEHLTANTRNTGRVVAYTRNTGQLTATTRNTGRIMTHTRNTGQLTANTRNTGRIMTHTRNTGQLTANTRNTGRIMTHTRNTGQLTANTRNTGRIMTHTRNTGQLTANTRNTGRIVTHTRNTGQLMANTRRKGGVLAYARDTGHITAYIHSTGNVTSLLPVQVTSASITHHKVEKPLPWWDGGLCLCDGSNCLMEEEEEAPYPRMSSHTPSAVVGGTCGRRSWAVGDGQRVVSFSLYGDNPEYWRGLDDILSQVERLYPGWVVRLYTDPRGRGSVLCPLLRDHAHLYVCDITGLPPPLGDLSQVHRAMWRLAPLGDPQVVTLIVRDLDSQVTEREAAAVRDWLSSEKHFHVMRDHPYHDLPIMAGMWGARWDQDPTLVRQTAHDMAALRDTMLRKAHGLHGYIDDQYILAELLYPAMTDRVMAHDSYWCGTYERASTPWPTQREAGVFVGSRSD
ncbi:uncharacterized protein [Panulirus ornatus]|uniref:uncharacterized protein isoform X2 n=1 Tax=Panulirus ornatus TaxID=150431 RepID=UPI003A8B0364